MENQNQYDDIVSDFTGVTEAKEFEPVPGGTYLVRMDVQGPEPIGKAGSLAFRNRCTILEGDFAGRVVEDLLFDTTDAKGRTLLLLHRVGGVPANITELSYRAQREALNGRLARITVAETVYQKKGDKTEYTADQAAEMRSHGEKLYARSRIKFAGYNRASDEEMAQHGEVAVAQKSKLPF